MKKYIEFYIQANDFSRDNHIDDIQMITIDKARLNDQEYLDNLFLCGCNTFLKRIMKEKEK